MNKRQLNNDFVRTYKNGGQHAEQVYAYTLTGVLVKASNLSHEKGGDVGNVQVKSSRATVCKGLDLKAYLDHDGAKLYAYVTADFETAYEMSRAEYEEFCVAFGTKTCESAKNGGAEKIRLKHETSAMLEWLRLKI